MLEIVPPTELIEFHLKYQVKIQTCQKNCPVSVSPVEKENQKNKPKIPTKPNDKTLVKTQIELLN